MVSHTQPHDPLPLGTRLVRPGFTLALSEGGLSKDELQRSAVSSVR